MDNNVIFIGNKEFEDTFQNNVICRCLNEYLPKNGDKYWVEEDIERLRNSTKFSKSLMDMVSKYKRETGAEIDYLRKPEFGIKIATTIEKDEIHEIEKLEILFKKINEIIR